MRLWILSDLHLEHSPLRQPLEPPEADVCIVAGDLCRNPAAGVAWLAEHIAPAMPCIYVAGNHEFYKGGLKEGLAAGRAAAEGFPDVHFLENEGATIGGVNFIGATLWTDFRVEGGQEMAMSYARERMNDYRQIALQKSPWMRLVPNATFRMHQDSRRFIKTALEMAPSTTVVVTHHLPHPASIAPRFRGDRLNAAYASDLTEVIQSGRPSLWVHGHTHDSFDYRIHDTRIICNPRGYTDENREFDVSLVVHL